jgi:hypothetical protein
MNFSVSTYHKIPLKMDHKIINHLEENICENSCNPGLGRDFFGTTKEFCMKEQIDSLESTKSVNLCSQKDTIKRIKRQARRQGKLFTKHISVEGLAFTIYKKKKTSKTAAPVFVAALFTIAKM